MPETTSIGERPKHDTPSTHLHNIDLNQLIPLSVLLEERHVSRAAGRLGLTQSGMSRALHRLRETFQDELLVRTGQAFELTSRAARIRRELDTILPRIELLFHAERINLSAMSDCFRIAATDYALTVLGPEVFRQVARYAPRLELQMVPWRGDSLDDVVSSRADLAIAGVSSTGSLRWEHLLEDHFVCVVADDHPLAGRSPALGEFLRHRQVVVFPDSGEQPAIDRHLHRFSTNRSIGLQVPSHHAAIRAVAGTTLVAVVPSRAAARHARGLGARITDAPLELEPLHLSMGWHLRSDADTLHQWMRGLIRSVAAGLEATPTVATPTGHARREVETC